MIPLMLFVISDTAIVETDHDIVYLHEWGVIEVDAAFPEALGAKWGYLDGDGVLEPWTGYEVEAPVIWFHGASCTGTLTVEAHQGFFTTMFPYPDSVGQGPNERTMSPYEVDGQTAYWFDISLSPHARETEESLPVAYDMGGFGWAAPFWREVGANYVSVYGSSFQDRFIYYECTAGSIPGIAHDCAGGDNTYGYRGPALVFSPSGGELSVRMAEVDEGIDTGDDQLTRLQTMAVICGWGGGLKSLELQALWKTWEPALRQRCIQGGETLMMFPLTPEQTESISTIRFVPGEGNRVEYSRLFLAVGSIR